MIHPRRESKGGKTTNTRSNSRVKKRRRNVRDSKTNNRRTRPPTPKARERITNPRLAFHGRAIRRAWRQFHDGSLSHWITTMVIALSLTIYGAVSLVLTNADATLARWQGDNRITVFFKPDATEKQRSEALSAISDELVVDKQDITRVSPDDALVRLKEMLGTEAGLLDELDENPLPHSVNLKLISSDPTMAGNLAKKIAEWSMVEAVSFDHLWAERLAAIIQAFRYGGGAFSFLLLAAVALIVSNTIKLTIIARRDEVEVMRFMGATHMFIKAPFIYEGILQGFLGASGALLLISLLYFGAQQTITDLGTAFGIQLTVQFLPTFQLSIIMGMGIVLGLTGALISLSRFLKV
ncbi:MAG: ABC transporter permease [Magnetococcales bacterium]|nr:ABC transporter permease [Magnetococcales bacterium]